MPTAALAATFSILFSGSFIETLCGVFQDVLGSGSFSILFSGSFIETTPMARSCCKLLKPFSILFSGSFIETLLRWDCLNILPQLSVSYSPDRSLRPTSFSRVFEVCRCSVAQKEALGPFCGSPLACLPPCPDRRSPLLSQLGFCLKTACICGRLRAQKKRLLPFRRVIRASA